MSHVKSMLEPYITARAVQPVVAALEALGHTVEALLAEAGIRRAILDDPDGRIPHGDAYP
jgi:hypothetical protein